LSALSSVAARPANQKRRIGTLRLFFALALVPVIFGVPALQNSPAASALMRSLGSLCITTAVLGRFWAILYLGGRKNAQIMQEGPYSICRHPLYLFSTIGAAGFGLLLDSLTLTVVFGLGAFAILSLTARREEAYLRATFGAAYDDYAARVPRILPWPWLFHAGPGVELNLYALRRNLADALVFIAAFPVAETIRLMHQAGLATGFGIF
jgi:protein-S-isoprenylcysteine O-methyltransferase Ste14